jgi:hypothetical protein
MRAARILGARTERIPLMIQELCEERADVLLSAPTPGNRRRSAPSPRLVPINPHHQVFDFRTWAGAANVAAIPMYGPQLPRSHQLASSPLDENTEPMSPTTLPAPKAAAFPPSRQQHPYFPPPRQQQQPYRRRSQAPPSPASPPRLERRMSWDGSAAANYQDFQPSFPPARSASITAPASPNLHPYMYARSHQYAQASHQPSIVFGNFSLTPNTAEMQQQQQQAPPQPSGHVAAAPARATSSSGVQPGQAQQQQQQRWGQRASNGLGLFERVDDEHPVRRPGAASGMIRPDVDGETITFGAIRVVRRREEGDRLMAAHLRGSVRDAPEGAASMEDPRNREPFPRVGEEEGFPEQEEEDGVVMEEPEEFEEGEEWRQGSTRGGSPGEPPSHQQPTQSGSTGGDDGGSSERLPNGAPQSSDTWALELEGLRIREHARRGVRRSA